METQNFIRRKASRVFDTLQIRKILITIGVTNQYFQGQNLTQSLIQFNIIFFQKPAKPNKESNVFLSCIVRQL